MREMVIKDILLSIILLRIYKLWNQILYIIKNNYFYILLNT